MTKKKRMSKVNGIGFIVGTGKIALIEETLVE
jgi:hypothetical protein